MIGPISILRIEKDKAGRDIALGYLPGVLPFATWNYDSKRNALYSGRYHATHEAAASDFEARTNQEDRHDA